MTEKGYVLKLNNQNAMTEYVESEVLGEGGRNRML